MADSECGPEIQNGPTVPQLSKANSILLSDENGQGTINNRVGLVVAG
ncbi:hypothetical protein [Desulfosporosinus sp. OT]|nr:hypothetical protein [Desulfosporosinus sp. OT]EGW38452.1 hypothetical protein DOT_3736 [Desulfosporosinus sp. OT]